MAELTTDPTSTSTSGCCAPETQASCCEPSDKEECCGAAPPPVVAVAVRRSATTLGCERLRGHP